MVTRDDYPGSEVAAAKAVLLEIWHVLGAYRNNMVIVGGWVPELLLNHCSPFSPPLRLGLGLAQGTRPLGGSRNLSGRVGPEVEGHVGSLDVDLALDHRNVPADRYRTILELLEAAGYQRDARQPFIFKRYVETQSGDVTVQVDLLAAEYHGTGRSHRTQRVQDLMPRKVRGCDLAFEAPVSLTMSGRLPNGAEDSVSVQVAPLHSFLVLP